MLSRYQCLRIPSITVRKLTYLVIYTAHTIKPLNPANEVPFKNDICLRTSTPQRNRNFVRNYTANSENNAMSRWSRFVCVSKGISSRSRTVSTQPRPERYRNVPLHHSVQTASGAHPPSFLSNEYSAPFPRVKRPGREADHSPPSSTEVLDGGE